MTFEVDLVIWAKTMIGYPWLRRTQESTTNGCNGCIKWDLESSARSSAHRNDTLKIQTMTGNAFAFSQRFLFRFPKLLSKGDRKTNLCQAVLSPKIKNQFVVWQTGWGMRIDPLWSSLVQVQRTHKLNAWWGKSRLQLIFLSWHPLFFPHFVHKRTLRLSIRNCK